MKPAICMGYCIESLPADQAMIAKHRKPANKRFCQQPANFFVLCGASYKEPQSGCTARNAAAVGMTRKQQKVPDRKLCQEYFPLYPALVHSVVNPLLKVSVFSQSNNSC